MIKGIENKINIKLHHWSSSKYVDHGLKTHCWFRCALTGKTVNLEIIQEIVSKYDLKIEIGGGVRSLDSVKQYVETVGKSNFRGSY